MKEFALFIREDRRKYYVADVFRLKVCPFPSNLSVFSNIAGQVDPNQNRIAGLIAFYYFLVNKHQRQSIK